VPVLGGIGTFRTSFSGHISLSESADGPSPRWAIIASILPLCFCPLGPVKMTLTFDVVMPGSRFKAGCLQGGHVRLGQV